MIIYALIHRSIQENWHNKQQCLHVLPLRWMLASEAADSAWDRCKAKELSRSLKWRLSSSLRSTKKLCSMHFSHSTTGLSSPWTSSSDSPRSPSMALQQKNGCTVQYLLTSVKKKAGWENWTKHHSSLSNATCKVTTLDQKALRCQLFNNQYNVCTEDCVLQGCKVFELIICLGETYCVCFECLTAAEGL